VNRAAIAHATNGPFWITHCSMANEMKSGNCGRLIARANLLRFQATWLRAALSGGILSSGFMQRDGCAKAARATAGAQGARSKSESW
jgi:hypothetical protein